MEEDPYMKKMLSVLLAAMMLIGLLAAPALADDQVLTVVTWDATTTPYLIAQKEAFEASHPGVKIEYVDVASQDYAVKATTMLEGGDTSDVFMIKEIDNLINWQAQGFAAPLADYIAKGYDMSGFVGTEVNYAVDGVQYAIPFRSDFWVLFYNKDLFDAAGVDLPTNDMTWGQYAELAKKLTDKEKDVYGTHYHTWLSAVVNWAVCGTGQPAVLLHAVSGSGRQRRLHELCGPESFRPALLRRVCERQHCHAAYGLLVCFHADRLQQGRHLQLQLGHHRRSARG